MCPKTKYSVIRKWLYLRKFKEYNRVFDTYELKIIKKQRYAYLAKNV